MKNSALLFYSQYFIPHKKKAYSAPFFRKNRKNGAGFTAIELLLAVVLLGIAAGIMLLALQRTKREAEITKGISFSAAVHRSLGAYAVGIWDFNAIEEGRVLDRSGYGNYGIVYGAVLTKGLPELGNALLFDGADGYVETVLTSNTEFQNGFTISVWIKPNSLGEENSGRIVDKSTEVFGDNGFYYGMSFPDTLIFQIHYPESGVKAADNSITFGSWQHVLVTIDSDSVVTHYINGVQSGAPGKSGEGRLAHIINSEPFTIGQRSKTEDRTFNGYIDEVRLYGQVLTAGEIQQLYVEGIKKYRGPSSIQF